MKVLRLLGSLGIWLAGGFIRVLLIIGIIGAVELAYPEADTTLVAFLGGAMLGLLESVFCRR